MNHGFLINTLNQEVAGMCGVGTRYVKLYLNSLINKGDKQAELLKRLLDCEMCNVNAKKYRNTSSHNYRNSYYNEKYKEVDALISFLMKNSELNVECGFQRSDVAPADYIVYFEHPLFGQISFHCDISQSNMTFMHKYKNDWDGITDSVLFKLEAAIEGLHGKEIREKYKDKTTDRLINDSARRVEIGKKYIFKSLMTSCDFDRLLSFDDSFKNNMPTAVEIPKNIKIPFNLWVIRLVEQRIGHKVSYGCMSVDDVYKAVVSYLSKMEDISFLSKGFSPNGLQLYIHNFTKDDKERFDAMFIHENQGEPTRFVCDFNGLSEKDILKLSAYMTVMGDKQKRNVKVSFCQYLKEKYNIPVQELNMESKKHKKKLGKARRNQERILMDTVTEYVSKHLEVGTYGIL